MAEEEHRFLNNKLSGEDSPSESGIECHKPQRGRSVPEEKEEGGGLWDGPCIKNRSLPDVEVRGEGTSHREHCVQDSIFLAGAGGGMGEKPSGLDAVSHECQ